LAPPDVLRDFLERSDKTENYDRLTPRELEVLKLIAEGRTSKEIAELLVLSIKTVERHRADILHRLGMRDASTSPATQSAAA
jgi:DNA-binding NarL/FixJ family response regulator